MDKATKAVIKTSFITIIIFFAALRIGPFFFDLSSSLDVAGGAYVITIVTLCSLIMAEVSAFQKPRAEYYAKIAATLPVFAPTFFISGIYENIPLFVILPVGTIASIIVGVLGIRKISLGFSRFVSIEGVPVDQNRQKFAKMLMAQYVAIIIPIVYVSWPMINTNTPG